MFETDSYFIYIYIIILLLHFLFQGEVTMEKVKVTRYVTGKRPDYAPDSSSDEDDEFGFQARKTAQPRVEEEGEKESELAAEEKEIMDRRLRRLQQRDRAVAEDSDEEEDRCVEMLPLKGGFKNSQLKRMKHW